MEFRLSCAVSTGLFPAKATTQLIIFDQCVFQIVGYLKVILVPGNRLLLNVLAEERQHMILESVGDGTGVRAGIDLELVRDSISIENLMQLASIDPQII